MSSVWYFIFNLCSTRIEGSFAISVTFVLTAVVVTNPVTLGIFLSTSSVLFSIPCLSESYFFRD